ncbi:MAG TPA: hypothetical protein DG753_03860 [Clostridium sp.]|nr:hypothetical protein [Clostridium sp.]
MIALASCILITCLLSVYRVFLQGYNNMNPIGISQIVEQFSNVIVSLLCSYLFIKYTKNIAWGVCGAQIGTSIGAFISILYIKFTVLRKVNIVKVGNKSFLNIFLNL